MPTSALANAALQGGLAITIGKTAKQIQNENILKQREHQRNASGNVLSMMEGNNINSNNASPMNSLQHARTVSGNGMIQPFVQTIYNGVATGPILFQSTPRSGGATGNSPPNNFGNNGSSCHEVPPPPPSNDPNSSNKAHHRRTSSHLANAFGFQQGGGHTGGGGSVNSHETSPSTGSHMRQLSMEMTTANGATENNQNNSRHSPSLGNQPGKSPMNATGGNNSTQRKSNFANAFR